MMMLAIVLLHTAITGFSSSAAVLDGKGLEASECSDEDCATLYLLTSTGEEIPIKKTISKMKQKDVAGARVVGSGCFTIFKGKSFSGSSITVAPPTKLMLAEQGHHWTTVKSVKYSPVCQRQAGAHLGHLGLAGLLALVLLAGLVYGRYQHRRSRRKHEDFLKEEEMKSLKPDGCDSKGEQEPPICKIEIPSPNLSI